MVSFIIFRSTHCLQNLGKMAGSKWLFIKCMEGNGNIVFSMHYIDRFPKTMMQFNLFL